METDDPYDWVRVDMTNPAAITAQQQIIETQRQYYYDRGCHYVG
jgi:hypothetical protein